MFDNAVTIQGRLTADPELRESKSGKLFCTFSIAYNQGKDISHFFNCVAFEKSAEYIQGRFFKGTPVLIGGQLTTSSWENQDGKKLTQVKIIVSRIVECVFKKREGAPVVQPSGNAREIFSDSEIPF